jgi:hypothetical protein
VDHLQFKEEKNSIQTKLSKKTFTERLYSSKLKEDMKKAPEPERPEKPELIL